MDDDPGATKLAHRTVRQAKIRAAATYVTHAILSRAMCFAARAADARTRLGYQVEAQRSARLFWRLNCWHYEEVLIVRVNPEIFRSEGLPDAPRHEKTVWHDRYRSIANFERHLQSNGTRIIKFFLHLSKEEQRKRFLARIDQPEKNWKFGSADVEERKFWKPYMKAYEECLSATSTRDAPWYIVPADDKENAWLIVSRIVLDALYALKMSYPKSSDARRRELLSIRKRLAK